MQKNKLWKALSSYRSLAGLVLLFVIASVVSPYFFTVNNLLNVLMQISMIGVLSVGMTMVIIAGGIDLSVGSLIAIVSVAVAHVLNAGGGTILAILAGVATGTAFGLFNGIAVAEGGIEPFIVTLATMAIARGAALVWSGAHTMIIEPPPAFAFISNGSLLGVPMPVVIAVVAFIIGGVVLRHSVFGRYVYAVGGNAEATRLSGIKVDLYRIAVFVISGALAGVAGAMYTSLLSIGEPTAGQLYELDAIAAVVIGGTSFAGGAGGIGLTAIGIMIIGLINNVQNLLNISPYSQEVVKGLIILIAVLTSKRGAASKG